MNPAADLLRLLGKQPPKESGVVSIVDEARIIVVLPSGPVPVTCPFPVAVGDSVLVHGGVIVGKVQHQKERPHYYL